MKEYRNLVVVNYVIGFIGIFLLAGLFTVFLVNGYKAAQARESENLGVLASTVASRTQTLIDTLLVTMRFLDEWIEVNPDIDPRFDPDFNRLINVYRNHTGNRIDIRMVTESGGLYHFPSLDPAPLAEVGDRDYFGIQESLPYHYLYFGTPVISRVTGNWGIPVTYKINKNKYGILFLFAVIEFKVFDELFQDMIQGSLESVSIVREDHTVLMRSPFNESILGTVYSFPEKDDGPVAFESLLPDTGRKIAYYRSLERAPLGVLIEANYSELNHNQRILLVFQSIIGCMILCGYLILIIRTSRLIQYNNSITEQLEKAARFDGLTGMRNRTHFLERMNEEMERTRRNNSKLIQLNLDIDHFKIVNDTWGHQVGDTVLKSMADTIEKEIRVTDISGRIGGEEFAVILTDTDIEKGLEVADRIRTRSLSVTHQTWKGSFSIGLAEWKGTEETLEQLMKRADEAMYEAKNGGRNRVEVAP